MRTQSKKLMLSAVLVVLGGVMGMLMGKPEPLFYVWLMTFCVAGWCMTRLELPLSSVPGTLRVGGAGGREGWELGGQGVWHPRATKSSRHQELQLEWTLRRRVCELERTNARLVEEMRRLRAERAAEASTERGSVLRQFAAGLGPSLDAPLTVLLSNLDYAQWRLDGPGAGDPEEQRRVREALADAREGAERMRQLAADLALLSAPERALGPVDVVATLRCAVEGLAHAGRGQARWEETLAEVPLARGDMARLGRVFHHLLTQATGGLAPREAMARPVRLAVRLADAAHVVVEVNAEEGIHSTQGLAWTVCRGIVASLGGELEVRSGPARGTTFRVSLPRYDAAS